MAIRKPIVLLDGNHLSELQAGDGIIPHLDPETATTSDLIQALIDAGVMEPPAASVPVNLSAPIVSGAVFVGDSAITTNGSWSGGPILEYEYLWQIDDDGWETIPGESLSEYEDIQIGEYRSGVRARNSEGWSDWAYSAPFVVTAPSAGMSFDGPASTNAILSNSDKTLQRDATGTHAIAWFDTPITGKVYIEFQFVKGAGDILVLTSGDGDMGVSTSAVPVVEWNTPRGDIAMRGWSSDRFANYGQGTNEVSGSFEIHGSELLSGVIGLCIDAATRSYWATTSGAYVGDPVAGTGPTFVINGSDPLQLGALVTSGGSITILSPDEHVRAAPTGFTPT